MIKCKLESKTGRQFFKMMAPVLGLENTPGIREMRITASRNDVVRLELDCIARFKNKLQVESDETDINNMRTRRFVVTVEEVEE